MIMPASSPSSDNPPPDLPRPARFFRLARWIARADSRVLVLLVMVMGIVAWTAPWQVLVPCFLLAVLCMCTAATHLPTGRAMLLSYISFALFWSGSLYALHLWEQPGQAVMAGVLAVDMGGRLLTLLGLAMIIQLNATPLVLGRVLNWYLWRVWRGLLFWQPAPPYVWRPGLALALMMSLLPRAWRALVAIKASMGRRAPHLPLHRRLLLMALAALRILGVQTWSVSLSIASRNLYRPEPWTWKK